MSRLTDLEAFAAVVSTGNFTRASNALGISKSYVSKQVAALEERLGVRLLNRTTRKSTPTEAGAGFYERAVRILEDLEEAEAAVTEQQTVPKGKLRLTVGMDFGLLYIAPAVAELMASYPELSIDVAFEDRLVDLVSEGFDLAIRVGRLKDSSLIAKKLADSRQIVCGSPAYFAEHGEPSTPEDVAAHRCLIYTYQVDGPAWRFPVDGDVRTVRVTGSFAANNGRALVEAAVHGVGLIQTPEFLCCHELRSGALRQVLTGYESLLPIWAVYPHNRHLSAKVRVFVDFLAERLSPPPWADCGG